VNVLIAGCGDLGTELGLRLAAAGHRVHGLRRRAALLPEPIIGIAADLGGQLPRLPADLDALVYAAAADAGGGVAAYRSAYRDGLAHVLDALAANRAPLDRAVFVSSTAVYGVDDGSEVDETTPAVPATATGRVLLETEALLAERVATATSLRLAGIYGPGRTRLIDTVRDGTARIPVPAVHANRIHRDDAARALAHLLTAVAQPAACYLGVDHAPVDRGEVLRFLADQLGVAHPPPGGPGRSRGGDKRCRNDALVATGFRFTYPTYREGYTAVLAGDGQRHP
jgi:nucleoside-diphosphate-sugar epimerase